MKRFIAVLIALVVWLSQLAPVRATEGLINLRNTRGDLSRCYVTSVLMRDQNLELLMTCRDLRYVERSDAFYYILWARDAETGRPFILGDVGIGKRQFTIEDNRAFSELFVTEEISDKVKDPSTRVVMSGVVESIPLFSEGIPAPVASPVAMATPVVAQVNVPRSNSGAWNALRIVGAIVGVVIVGVIVIAVISTSRRRPIDI